LSEAPLGGTGRAVNTLLHLKIRDNICKSKNLVKEREREGLMTETEYGDSERRKYFRHNLMYAPRKAKLKIEDCDYEVKDISKGGLRFLSDAKLEKQIRGILTVSDNEPKAIEGIIVWRIGNEVGLKFKAISKDAFGFKDEA